MKKEKSVDNALTKISEINPEMLKVIDRADFSDWSRDQFITAGEEASKIKYYSQWVLGKLADKYCKKWGDLPAYARSIHQEPDSLRVYRWVYKKITKSMPDYVPDGYLTWRAIQIIASYDKPIDLIEELSGKGKITGDEVIQHIKAKERKKEGKNPLPKKPKVKITFNEEVEKWELDIIQKDFDELYWLGKFKERFSKYLKRIWETE